ncbi:MAG: fasciclin domain-containing protein [Phenylobacterium sp.]
MTIQRLLSAAAAASLIAGAAYAQAPAQPSAKAAATTEKAAQAATGKATSDAPAKTAVQGTARAVGDAAVNAQATAPAAPATAPAAAPGAKVVANGDIMSTLRSSGQFNTFVKALDATNLSGLLQKQPNITVFAPTDAAFAALPAGELDKLMADKPGLQKLLVYHLINARVDSTKIKGARGPVPAGSGDKIVLDGSAENGQLKAENANILQADVAASNGLIQVVDQVLKPNSVPETLPDAAASATPAASTEAAQPAEPAKPAAKPAAKKSKK